MNSFSPTLDFSRFFNELKLKKILITGGTGFVGKSICEVLVYLNQQYDLQMEITALGRSEIVQDGVRFFKHNIETPLPILESFHFIIHAASPVGVNASHFEQALHTIVTGTENILEFAKKSNAAKLLLISSGAVYGEQPSSLSEIPEDFTIQDPFFNPTSAYVSGKRLSEQKSLEFASVNGLHLNIARCFAFSGRNLPLDKHFAIGNFVRDALLGHSIKVKGDGSAVRSYLDSEDLVMWLLTILLYGEKNDIFNVGSDLRVSIKELAHIVAAHFNKIDVVVENTSNEMLKSNIYIPSIAKAKNKLGLKVMTSLDSSIQKMIQFNREIK